MNYPLLSDYIEAIKSAEDNFDVLSNLRPVLDNYRQPVMSSGNFAVVFKMRNEQTGKLYAVKCFLKEQEGRAEAYRLISEELEFVSSPYLTPIKYLDNELFVDTESSNETVFPVLLMDWVEGETLDKYIYYNKYDGDRLSGLALSFYDLSLWLLSQPFAHGDLKPDNILVTNEGNLVLIDYDGMYVPKMFGQKPRECGSPNYRVPYNSNWNMISKFNKSIDDFAIIHILLSLRTYFLYPRLINSEKEFAIFSHKDFSNIYSTSIYTEILRSNIDNNISALLMLFHKCISFGYIDKSDLHILDFTEPENRFANMEELMCNFDNILNAVNLAYSSMCYKDPARNEFELNEYRDINSRISLANEIHKNLKRCEWPYGFGGIKYSRLKSNGIEYREGVALDLLEYSLRYLFGLVKFISIDKRIPSFTYSGGSDVFTLSDDEYKFESYLDEFVKVQESYSKQYKYLYVFDIRNYFKSISIGKLKDTYFDNYFCNVNWFGDLFNLVFDKENLQGLNPCSEVDFFFANLYLKPLDDELSKIEGITYLRYCDDIRIFSNENGLLETLTNIVNVVLASLSLKINHDKTKIIDTSKDKKELATACFVWSDSLYLGIKNAETFLNGKSLEEIIKEDLSTTYVFHLLKDIDDKALSTYWNKTYHIDSLFYILKRVHKNATFYRMVSELLFGIGMNYERYECELEGLPPSILKDFINLLKDDTVEPFVKYWVVRTFFCSSKGYYNWYANMTWGYCDNYLNQIISILDKNFRKENADKLLSYLSDYIISYNIANATDDLTDSQKEDLASAWEDEQRVMYDSSGKKLIEATIKMYFEEYVIREGTEIICDKAFAECGDLTSIKIPDSITSIGIESFWECIGLTNITIPNRVMSIGEKAFCRCVNLRNILIPSSVTSIGDEAFSCCCNLSSIVVEKNNVTYDSRNNCNAIIKTFNNKLIVGCKNTIIPNNVASIGNHAFSYCEYLTIINIPKSVTSIGDYAFLGCRSLTSITIPENVTSIGYGAFSNCRRLSSVTISNSSTCIGESVFNGCKSLTSIIIPKGTRGRFEKYFPNYIDIIIEQ